MGCGSSMSRKPSHAAVAPQPEPAQRQVAPKEVAHSQQSHNQPKKEEPKKEEPKKEEPKKEEPKKEEPKKEEPKREEPKREEPKREEPKNEEPKREEPKNEEPKKEEPKKEEPKKEEPKKEEPKKEEPKEEPKEETKEETKEEPKEEPKEELKEEPKEEPKAPTGLVGTGKDAEAQDIDENLQSRQLAVYGRQAMAKLTRSRIIISGMNGLGAEIAKNISLANVGHISLHDTRAVALEDLSANFFLSASDVGQPRAVACVKKVQELNPLVKVDVITHRLEREDILSSDVIVLVESSFEAAVRVNAICRERNPPVAFIRTDIHGVFGSVFTDFGPDFTVHDKDGEEIKTAIIQEITKGTSTTVTCVSGDRLEFEEGDYVTFSEVEGMVELNDCPPVRIEKCFPYKFLIGDTSSHSDYIRGGIVTQVKMPVSVKFLPLLQSVETPGEFLIHDYSKMERPNLLHSAFRALDRYYSANEQYPQPLNEDHALELLKLVKEYHKADISESDSKVIKAFARGCCSIINPMAAIFGGIVGQEVVKACTGKFHPIFQWFYLDSVESLPDDMSNAEDFTPAGSRYDHQISVFGHKIQDKLLNLKYFLVGAGALGCEFLKNFALMGVSSGPEGQLIVTDDDSIEKSNLTRQFLFRNWMIGQSKSSAAANVVKGINPHFNVKAMQDRVSTDTETIFNDEFWESLDGICNALDNVKARLYVDSRCLFYAKPLLESGTLGTKCNSQMIVPHLTQNYGASSDPPEKVAPDCTLHNFPHNIQHCLSWARSDFIGHFESVPTDANACFEKGEDYIPSLSKAGLSNKEIREKLVGIKDFIIGDNCQTFEDCVKWARLKFQDLFVNRIKQLVFSCPHDLKTTSGAPFWSPPKRFPTPLDFDAEDDVHMQFIMSAANLRAVASNIPQPPSNRDVDMFRTIVAQIEVPEFVPVRGYKVQTDEADNAGSADPQSQADSTPVQEEVEVPMEDILREILSIQSAKPSPVSFEKDDDTNFHMDYIGSVGNLRARNYDIKEVDKLQAKLIAGRIIPAIATTTAMITGFVCLELYKIVQNKPLESYRNLYANLAIPLFSMSEPVPPAKLKTRVVKTVPDPYNHPEYEEEETITSYPEGHTIWDRLDIDLPEKANATLRQIIEHVEAKHKIKVDSISIATAAGGGAILYNKLMEVTHSKLGEKIGDLFLKYTNRAPDSVKYMLPSFGFSDEEGNYVETPLVVYHMR